MASSKSNLRKEMLSEALHKANNAVFFDNRQNFEDAIRAYGDCCAMLRQVMRTTLEKEDRERLEAIRITYIKRIHELQEWLAPSMHHL
ncbi:hypothetical protein MMC28_003071 [Mycoblastus sanguinarius]|nr:hypothetical protein [Mycoblastus sanguinarius]